MTKYANAMVTTDHLSTMLICTVRYAMGRATYVVRDTCDMVRSYRSRISKDQLAIIERDVARRLREHEDAGTTLGHDMDHREWQRLVEELRGSE